MGQPVGCGEGGAFTLLLGVCLFEALVQLTQTHYKCYTLKYDIHIINAYDHIHVVYLVVYVLKIAIQNTLLFGPISDLKSALVTL